MLALSSFVSNLLSGFLEPASGTAKTPRWQSALEREASFMGNLCQMLLSEPPAGLSWEKLALNIRQD